MIRGRSGIRRLPTLSWTRNLPVLYLWGICQSRHFSRRTLKGLMLPYEGVLDLVILQPLLLLRLSIWHGRYSLLNYAVQISQHITPPEGDRNLEYLCPSFRWA